MNGATAPASNMMLLEKWAMINKTIFKNKIAILALQETHLDQQMMETIVHCFGKNLDIFFSAPTEAPQVRAGIAFIINKALITPRKITTHELIPRRAMMLKIKWLETSETHLINIYAPNNREAQQDFWNDVDTQQIRKHLPHPDFVLHTDSWYVSACFVAIGLPTVRIWDCANAGCHSWNPLTCLLSRFVPLTEG